MFKFQNHFIINNNKMENKTPKKKTSRSKKSDKPEETKQKNNDQLMVNLPLGFIKYINNILLIANQRAHWHPSELIPVGTALKELDNIIRANSEDSRPSTTESTDTS